MRVSTAFNKMLGIVGATVASVTFTPTGVVVGLRRRRSKPVCPCGRKSKATYDRSVRRWRHLDLAGSKLWLERGSNRISPRLVALRGTTPTRRLGRPYPVDAADSATGACQFARARLRVHGRSRCARFFPPLWVNSAGGGLVKDAAG